MRTDELERKVKNIISPITCYKSVKRKISVQQYMNYEITSKIRLIKKLRDRNKYYKETKQIL